jgi:guanine deaminase
MHNYFMERAITLALENVQKAQGGPFGAVIVKDNEIIAEGVNLVTATHDPTAHAEIVAIRRACAKLNSFQLKGCLLYTSCEPCPMCFGAVYWARPEALYFGATKADAAAIGFDDSFIYEEIARDYSLRSIPMTQMMPDRAREVFVAWEKSRSKISY